MAYRALRTFPFQQKQSLATGRLGISSWGSFLTALMPYLDGTRDYVNAICVIIRVEVAQNHSASASLEGDHFEAVSEQINLHPPSFP